MKGKSLTIICMAAAICLNAAAQPSGPRPNETVLLYADEFSDTTDPIRAEKITAAGFEMAYDNGVTGSEKIEKNGSLSMTGRYARFDLYFPEQPNGQMIIVCQGGGYSVITSFGGINAADWMLERGITVAVLKYRLPYGHPDVLREDVHNTLRYCRAHAQEWGVTQIGIEGTSAGGHLAGLAAVSYDDMVTRPDFAVLIYPVVSFGDAKTHNGTRTCTIGDKAKVTSREGKSWEEWNEAKKNYDALVEKYSLDRQVSADNPPIFIALSSDDNVVNPENSIGLYSALLKNHVPVEMHIYPKGGHGWGFASRANAGTSKDPLGLARNDFSAALERWLAAVKDSSEK